MSEDAPDESLRPALRIVHGSPTEAEIAALTAVVAAAAGLAEDSRPRARRGGWNDPGAAHRRPLRPGPNAWRAAYLP